MRARVALAALSLMLAATACAADTVPAANATTTSTSPSAPATPSATGSASIDPVSAYGSTVQITDEGFHPRWLLYGPGEPITWQNQTDHPVEVVFDHQSVRSGPIPPGGTWNWSYPTPISITYHAGGDRALVGSVQLQTV